MKKVESNRSLFEEIPSPVIWDILLRLPTKACLNCKLVCKEWYQIIISLEFGALRSSRCSFFTILLYGKFYSRRKNFLLLDLDKSSKINEMGNLNASSEAMIRFKSKFSIPHHKLFVINECDGLVCLKSYGRWTPYIICNVLTSQQVIIEQVRKPSCTVEVYGFGCCPVLRVFKVLRLLKMGSFKSVAELCSLGTNEWRAVGDAPLCQFHSGRAFLHGSLHRYSYSDNCIWSFHFGNEQFLRIPMPDGLNTKITRDVSVFQSHLSLCSLSESLSRCEIWVMKEYGMGDSWVKLFVLDTEFSSTRMPLFQVDDRETLVCYGSGFALGTSDIQSGKCKRAQILGVSFFRVTACNVKFSKL